MSYSISNFDKFYNFLLNLITDKGRVPFDFKNLIRPG
jgi:hypothetical protein